MKETVLTRFMRYIAVETTSNEESFTSPSTKGQLTLGAMLADEMKTIGLSDVEQDVYGCVYGRIPATKGCETRPVLGFIAHMDTSDGAPGASICPRVVKYEGGDLPLGHGKVLSPAVFPSLERYIGEELIVTDGATLLGADDKAGVAEIMSAAAELSAHPERSHGEIEYENFNAASAALTVAGVNIHPGGAKNKMKNALLLASEWMNRLPPAETPAHTEGYEGFYHVHHMSGDETRAEVRLLVRDHDRDKFEARKAFLGALTDYMNTVWGDGTFSLTVRDSYYNMKEMILPHKELIENAEAAMRAAGVEPICVPIRGGTDGARLSYMGLPCPNLSTGGTNFHGVHEYIPVRSMETMVEVLLHLMRGDA